MKVSIQLCMQYSTTESADGPPVNPTDCVDVIQVEIPKEGQFDRGQMYTGPWDTENGVTVKWIPSENAMRRASFHFRSILGGYR